MLSLLSQQNKSSSSQLTKSISQVVTEEEITDEELYKQVNVLKRQHKVLALENRVLENTIMRLDPSLMNSIQQALEYALRLQQSSNSFNTGGSFFKPQTSKYCLESMISQSRMFSPSKVSSKRADSLAKVSGTIFGTGPRINVLERSELVSTEMEIVVKNLEKYRRNAEKQHALLKAQLEEIGLREKYIKKATDMFHQTVVVDGWDKIAQRIPAEIWIRFINEWNKIVDTHIGKLRLRTSTLNTQHNKLKGQIKTKKELSESLRPVDFEKLEIENKECLKTIDQKVQQLEELKKLTGDANLNLTVHKKAMMEQDEYLKKVLSSIEDKKKQTTALEKENAVIQALVNNLQVQLEELKKVRLKYEVPNTIDYVKVKSDITDLKQSIKILENRAHVQDITLASLNRKLKSIQICPEE
ncbi:uncharacterized protein LOC121738372 [Aricia agestis]|uniref:uncharacterized protein LOC121738372 n=1 Tax=Aricia agestis TaxID=91739 RepID=UPI001C203A7B|nr:uncharacterized protein LOC121738372 [Aricia agestis]